MSTSPQTSAPPATAARMDDRRAGCRVQTWRGDKADDQRGGDRRGELRDRGPPDGETDETAEHDIASRAPAAPKGHGARESAHEERAGDRVAPEQRRVGPHRGGQTEGHGRERGRRRARTETQGEPVDGECSQHGGDADGNHSRDVRQDGLRLEGDGVDPGAVQHRPRGRDRRDGQKGEARRLVGVVVAVDQGKVAGVLAVVVDPKAPLLGDRAHEIETRVLVPPAGLVEERIGEQQRAGDDQSAGQGALRHGHPPHLASLFMPGVIRQRGDAARPHGGRS